MHTFLLDTETTGLRPSRALPADPSKQGYLHRIVELYVKDAATGACALLKDASDVYGTGSTHCTQHTRGRTQAHKYTSTLNDVQRTGWKSLSSS